MRDSLQFSIGDWFVLYQMNKNMNKRFFAEFVALLSMKVNKNKNWIIFIIMIFFRSIQSRMRMIFQRSVC